MSTRNGMTIGNNFIFYSMLILLITILTAVNNYYFYEHVYDTSGRNASQLEYVLNTIDKNTKNYEQQIVSISKAFSEKAYYNGVLVIKNKDNVLIWEKPIYVDSKIVSSNIEIKINDEADKKAFNYTYHVDFNFQVYLLSIFKSMTFSAQDFLYDTYVVGMKQAIIKYQKSYFKRSRPVIGFFIFSFILLRFYRNRELTRSLNEEKQEKNLQEIFRKKVELEEEKEKLDSKHESIHKRLQQYDHIINPPIDTLNFNELVSKETRGIANKFRQTVEKLFFPIFQNHFNYKIDNLGEAIYKLADENIISSETKASANLIRTYGNMDSHYSDHTISKNEIMALAEHLLFIVEEIVSKDLLIVQIGKKKYFDKKTKKWITVEN